MNPIALLLGRLFGSGRPPSPLGPTGAAAGLTPSTLFERISGLIFQFAEATSLAVIEGLWFGLHVLLPALLVLYVGYMLYKLIWGQTSGGAVFAATLWALLIYWVAGTLAEIQTWFVGGIAALSSLLTVSASQGLGNGAVPTTNAAFGAILNDAMLVGVDLWRSLGWSDWVGALLVAVFFLLSFVAIAYVWWMAFKADLWLLVLATMTPIPLTAALVPATRGLFFRWVDTIWGFIMLKVIVVVFVQILLGVLSTLVGEILATNTGVADKIMLTLCAILVFVAMLLMAFDIPRVAASLGGGTIMHGPGATTGFAVGWASRAYGSHRARQERNRERDDRVAEQMRHANP